MQNSNAISIAPARGPQDWAAVRNLRWGGYRKFYSRDDDVMDEFDSAANATVLIAKRDDGEAVGTIRILDRSRGRVELDSYQDIALWPSGILSRYEEAFLEATRFCVSPGEHSKLIKLLIWKAVHRFALAVQSTTIIAWVRPELSDAYRKLLFHELPQDLAFAHPILGNELHLVFKCDVVEAESRLRCAKHPLYEFFFLERHPGIQLTQGSVP